MKHAKKKPSPPEKTATDNQWDNANLRYYPDSRPRRDGPGGEEGEKKG